MSTETPIAYEELLRISEKCIGVSYQSYNGFSTPKSFITLPSFFWNFSSGLYPIFEVVSDIFSTVPSEEFDEFIPKYSLTSSTFDILVQRR